MIPASLLIDFAKKHKSKLMVLTGFAVAFVSGWVLHRPAPQPAVELHQDTKSDTSASGAKETHKTEANRTVDIDVGGWASPAEPTPGRRPAASKKAPATATSTAPIDFSDGLDATEIAQLPPGSHVHIQEGPSTEDTKSVVTLESKEETNLNLKVSPPSLPNWAAAVGVVDPFGDRKLHFELGRRIYKEAWVRGEWTPSDGVRGFSVIGEIRF